MPELISWRRRTVVITLTALLASCDYSAEVKKSMQRILKQDFRAYHFFATPAGNFGAGTMYLRSAQNRSAAEIGNEALIAIPETYFADHVPAPKRAEILKELFPEAAFGTFSVQEKLATRIGLDVAVPGISGVLTGGAALDLKKGVEVSLEAGRAAVRKLNWTELRRARREKQLADDIVQHLDARDVVIAMNDVVVNGYTAVVRIDAAANATLKGEMDKAAAQAPVTLPTGKVTFSTGQNGTYRITVNEPVVVAILFKEIPVGAQASENADTWPSVSLSKLLASRLGELAVARRLAVAQPK